MDQIIDNPEQEQISLPYAGFWIRVGASLIDGLIMGCIFGVVFLALFMDQLVEDIQSIKMIIVSETFIYFNYVTAITTALYVILMESSGKQGTLGKIAVGIKVGKENGERVTLVNALGRYVSKNFFVLIGSIPVLVQFGLLFNFLFIAGCLLVVWDKNKQALHDKIAKTYVFVKK